MEVWKEKNGKWQTARPVIGRFLFWILNILLPMLLGFTIYLLWTEDTYISITVRALFSDIPLIKPNSLIGRLARNYLCDMCWAYSLVFCIVPLLGLTPKRIKVSVRISSLFAAAMECMQYFHVFSGTFDVLDILLEIIACALAGLMIKYYVWRKKK